MTALEEQLLRELADARAQNASLQATLSTMAKALADQKEAMDRLVAQYKSFQKQLFGQKSEKRLPSTKKVTGKKS